MSLRRNRYVILVPALLLVVALALPGCSHQVLTFFFTGVPEPGQEDTAAVTADPAAKRQERVRVRISYSFVHGPVGANRCNLCHQSRGGNVFSQPGGSAVPVDARSISPRTVQPLAELCLGCHSDHGPNAARETGLWQHGPVANQQCTVCHSAHKSARRFLLLESSNVEMCGRCHSSGDLRHTPQHAVNPAVECTDCHNPHAGKSPSMLKEEYDERSRFDRT